MYVRTTLMARVAVDREADPTQLELDMRRNQLAGAATIVLGATMMTSAVLGPLVLGVIRFRVSPAMERQLVGGELATLALAGPLAIVAGALWFRGVKSAPVIAIGPLGYALYTYVQFILVPDYTRYSGNNERWFPMYLLMVMASWIMAVEAWREIEQPTRFARHRTTRLLGALLLLLNSLFALAWWSSIATTYLRGASAEYREYPTAFWLVRLMDLGFLIPVGLVVAIGLLRRRAWATRAGYAIGGMELLLGCAVAAMAQLSS